MGDDKTAEALRNVFGFTDKDSAKVDQLLNEHMELKQKLIDILPVGADGKQHISLEFVPKDENGRKRQRKTVEKRYNGSQLEEVTVDDVQEGLMSLDTVFRLALVCAEVMKRQAWERDVIKASSDDQSNGGLIRYDAEKLEGSIKAVGGSAEDYEEAFSAAVEIGRLGITWNTIPFKGLILYFEVLVCSLFVIVLTCVCLIQYAMQMIEYSIVTGFSIVLIPLMLFDGTKDYAMKIIAMLFHETVKLAMVVMMMYYNFGLYGAMCKAVLAQQDNSFGLTELSFVAFSAILGFAFVSNAPKLASTIVTGQPQMSMGEFVGSAAAMGGAAAAAGGAGLMVGGRTLGAIGGFGKGVGTGINNWKDIRANGGSRGQALKSALTGGAVSGVGNVLGALAGKGSGSSASRHLTEFGKNSQLVRSEKQAAETKARVASLTGGSGSRSSESRTGNANGGGQNNQSNREAMQRSANAESKASDASAKASTAMQKADSPSSGGGGSRSGGTTA